MATQTRPRLVDDSGIWFGIAIGLLVVTFLATAAFGLAPSTIAYAVLIVGGLAAARLPGIVALGLGAVAWAFFTGFIENTYGQLTFSAPDVERLGAFAVSTVLMGALVRWTVTRPSHG